jgi:hypothetical protein
MLTIRRQQVDALARAMESQFLENIVQRVVRREPLECRPETAELREMAKQALLQAREFTVLTPAALSAFVEHCLVRRELFSPQLRIALLAEEIEGAPLDDQKRMELLVRLQEAGSGETKAVAALRARAKQGPKMAADSSEADE